jgi:hypothetical protein
MDLSESIRASFQYTSLMQPELQRQLMLLHASRCPTLRSSSLGSMAFIPKTMSNSLFLLPGDVLQDQPPLVSELSPLLKLTEI